MPLVSVVVPVYKAQGCLEELYRRLCASVGSITPDFELVLVEDCGGDRSWELVRELCARDHRVHGIQLSRNFGQHAAITAGLDHCAGEWVVVMDCDLQDRPEEIPNLYAKAVEGYDLVLAQRVDRKDSLPKRALSRAFYAVLSWVGGRRIDPSVANFGIYHRRVVDAVGMLRECSRFFPSMVQWVGFRSTYLAVQHAERFAGESSYTFTRSVNLALSVLLSSSDRPLRLIVRLGCVISGLAFLYALSVAIAALEGRIEVLGWASLIVSIWLLGGVVIALLGVVGLYVGKTFEEGKARPLYLTRWVVNAHGTKPEAHAVPDDPERARDAEGDPRGVRERVRRAGDRRA